MVMNQLYVLALFSFATALPQGTITTSPAPTPGPTLASEISFAIDCATSYSNWWYTLLSKENDPNNLVVSYFDYYNYTTSDIETFGTADVFTTIDGLPYAHGTFTPTSSADWSSVFVTAASSSTSWITNPNDAAGPEPTCAPEINQDACPGLYSWLRSSLGIAQTAPIPASSIITYWGPYHYCSSIPYGVQSGCTFAVPNHITAFYWPSRTSVAGSPPSTSVFGDITMTSPSVYLSIDGFGAYAVTEQDGGHGGNPGIANAVGTSYANAITSYDLTDISTVIRTEPGRDMTAVVSRIVHQLQTPQNQLPKTRNLIYPNIQDGTVQANLYDAIDRPPTPFEYYLANPYGIPAPGCVLADYWREASDVLPKPPNHECATAYDVAFNPPLFDYPAKIRSMQPEWKDCHGVADALANLVVSQIEVPAATAAALAAAEAATTPATPVSGPTASTPAPTASS